MSAFQGPADIHGCLTGVPRVRFGTTRFLSAALLRNTERFDPRSASGFEPEAVIISEADETALGSIAWNDERRIGQSGGSSWHLER